jgi:hypothetical protein
MHCIIRDFDCKHFYPNVGSIRADYVKVQQLPTDKLNRFLLRPDVLGHNLPKSICRELEIGISTAATVAIFFKENFRGRL